MNIFPIYYTKTALTLFTTLFLRYSYSYVYAYNEKKKWISALDISWTSIVFIHFLRWTTEYYYFYNTNIKLVTYIKSSFIFNLFYWMHFIIYFSTIRISYTFYYVYWNTPKFIILFSFHGHVQYILDNYLFS